jgi:hypothetical protein
MKPARHLENLSTDLLGWSAWTGIGTDVSVVDDDIPLDH